MGKFKDEHGESRIGHFFRESKLVNGIKKIAPELVDGLGDFVAAKTGIEWFDEIGDKISKKQDVPNDVKLNLIDKIREERLRFEAELKDIQSARDMQIAALNQDDKFAKRFIYMFATAFALVTVILVTLLFFVEVPQENKTLVDMSLGVLIGTGLTGIFNFFYGSSHKTQ